MNRAQTLAYRVLTELHIDTLPVDPACLLRRCRDTVLWTYEEAADRLRMPVEEFERLFGVADAFTLHENGQTIVAYRSGGNPARLRFTLAHELGHRLLHINGSDADSPGAEQEADAFASHLLCPRPALARLMERFPALMPRQIATAFFVSAACAREVLRTPNADADEALLAGTDALLKDAIMNVREIPVK